ncbi:phospholipase D-like domain-containing protein [Novosphingobium album (ex Liu et al. 2023)]|uniref:Phospholipase D n=1 Tax=Novosphingobium album (ex Liu et al. 2023) TaxID=3031130 RepID=A0ABT5WR37_9SPHN|nr:phospholipase D-like domain-containing protein [Novosphingobium album (ex Liu et al. 2023)]MDE8652508.1 phospholipase D-like domain-containing protein [Novosphingobium album (ex Liu et al. 2023)]
MEDSSEAERTAINTWFERLKDRDADLHRALLASLNENQDGGGPALRGESTVRAEAAGLMPQARMRTETIVQLGRPALFVVGGQIQPETPLSDSVSKLMVERVTAASGALNPWMPLIGRIDVENHPAGFNYVGTGWLIQPGLVCTNRHVAELIGRREGAEFTFSRGRFGKALGVSLNPGHENGGPTGPGGAFPISGIAWIEPQDGPDIALLHVNMPDDGTRPRCIELADDDGQPDDFIATIGYPARAYEDAIPDQDWMDEIYGGIYDVKRIAPGQLDELRADSTTYDCTTLGGASGSPVFGLKHGKVIALHFAGLYKIENYGVPARVLRKYAQGIPSVTTTAENPAGQTTGTIIAGAGAIDLRLASTGAESSIVVPLRISLSLGEPAMTGADAMTLDAAVASLAARDHPGVLAVKPGFDGRSDCIVVAVSPDRFAAVSAAIPATFAGYPVDVRYATIREQLGLSELGLEASGAIVYDDTRRQGPAFSFEEVSDEDMTVIAHVGPEFSFPVLARFIGETRTSLTSSMYQFFASHIADAVRERLESAQVRMRLVLDPATRDGTADQPKPGEFDRSDTFAAWRAHHAFENIYVRKGNGGLVSSAYHIKVTVRDGEWVWLSSGNWTKSSQPAPDPVTHRAKGNREWHIVIRSPRLSAMFAAHIEADFAQCGELMGTAEAPAITEQLVDVPEDVVVEAPVELLEPLEITGRKVRVKPILTPDRHGRVYTDAVLDLIASARGELLFQNQYIKIRRNMAGNLGELVDALVAKSKAIENLRIILRSGDVADDVAELRRRGMDVMRCVRVIANTHTKGIIADGQRVIIGSQNWSSDAVTLNRDASLLFTDADIAGYFRKAFEIDWARARPAAGIHEERPVLPARGEAPPPGYVRMTLAEYLNG